MEGFDENRVRRILRIPRTQIVPLIIALGYSANSPARKTRLPIEPLIHRDGW